MIKSKIMLWWGGLVLALLFAPLLILWHGVIGYWRALNRYGETYFTYVKEKPVVNQQKMADVYPDYTFQTVKEEDIDE